MNFVFILLALLFGIMFIASGLKCYLPMINRVYLGTICNIDDNLQVATVEYIKKGEKCQSTLNLGKFSNSMLNINFNCHVGMKVSVTLDERNNIQTLMLPKNNNEKRKISWGVLLIGLLMVGYGVYKSIQIITNFIHN